MRRLQSVPVAWTRALRLGSVFRPSLVWHSGHTPVGSRSSSSSTSERGGSGGRVGGNHSPFDAAGTGSHGGAANPSVTSVPSAAPIAAVGAEMAKSAGVSEAQELLETMVRQRPPLVVERVLLTVLQ